MYYCDALIHWNMIANMSGILLGRRISQLCIKLSAYSVGVVGIIRDPNINHLIHLNASTFQDLYNILKDFISSTFNKLLWVFCARSATFLIVHISASVRFFFTLDSALKKLLLWCIE